MHVAEVILHQSAVEQLANAYFLHSKVLSFSICGVVYGIKEVPDPSLITFINDLEYHVVGRIAHSVEANQLVITCQF